MTRTPSLSQSQRINDSHLTNATISMNHWLALHQCHYLNESVTRSQPLYVTGSLVHTTHSLSHFHCHCPTGWLACTQTFSLFHLVTLSLKSCLSLSLFHRVILSHPFTPHSNDTLSSLHSYLTYSHTLSHSVVYSQNETQEYIQIITIEHHACGMRRRARDKQISHV